MAISKLTGKALDLGTDAIEDFASTGIDDNSTSTVMTIASTGDVTFTNNVAATYFTGDGSTLTALNATQLTSGTIPDARFPSALPAIDGSALTGIEALPSSIFANGSATANTLHIAANSNIGIGTVSPAAKLEVTGSVLVSDDGIDDFVKLVVDTTNTAIEFGATEGTGGGAKFLYDRAAGTLSGSIGANAITQFMSVASDGQVTIGALQSGAVQPLAPALNLRTSSNLAYLTAWSTTGNYTPSNSDLIQVKNYQGGVDDVFAGIWFETPAPATNTTGERTGRIALVPQNDAAYGANFTFSTRRAATAALTETMRLTHNGDMLVGTSTESGARLHVENDTGTIADFRRAAGSGDWAYVYITAGSTTGNSRLYFSDTASSEGGIDYEHSTDQFVLFAGNTFTFSANGNSNAFFLQGNGKAAFQHAGGSGADLSIGSDDNTDTADDVVIRIGHGPTITARTAEIRKSRDYVGDAAAFTIRASTGGSDSPILFYSDNTTERAQISKNGSFCVGNNAPSSSVRLKVQGTAANTETAVEFFKIGTTSNYKGSIMKLWSRNSGSFAGNTVTEILLDAMNGYTQVNAEDNNNLVDGSYRCYSNAAWGGDSYIVVQPSGGGEMRGINGGSGNWYVQGTLSKGSGSFRIPHPLASKRGTHRLVHSFAESPGADLFYSGMVNLIDGSATINIDTEAGMTEGTFVALCREVRRHCTNESGFTAVKSSIVGNILTITAEDPTCTDEVFWMVVGERQDPTIYESTMTDDDGKVIVEPLIAAEA